MTNHLKTYAYNIFHQQLNISVINTPIVIGLKTGGG